jgi:HSP20 family molecular chaperone IbpA
MNRNTRTAAMVAAPVGSALGAAIGYLFDPDRGKARRRRLVDRSAAVGRRLGRRIGARARYQGGRVQGGLYRARGAGVPEPADDVDVKQQIHQALRAAGVDLRDVTVEVSDRTAVLRGQVADAADIDRIEQIVQLVRGVFQLENYLHPPGEPAPNKLDALRLSGPVG